MSRLGSWQLTKLKYDKTKLTKKEREMIESVQRKPYIFKRYKKEKQFRELALIAVEADDVNFTSVAPPLLTDDFVDEAISLNGRVLIHLDTKEVTYKRCLTAVESGRIATLHLIPEEFRKEELLKKLLSKYPKAISEIEAPTEDMYWEALRVKPSLIAHIPNPTEKMVEYVVKENGINIRYAKNPSEELCIEAVKCRKHLEQPCYPFNVGSKLCPLFFIKNQTERICLESVKTNGLSLEYAQFKTPEICLEAIKNNGLAIRFVKNQTPELCMLALEQNESAIKYFNL